MIISLIKVAIITLTMGVGANKPTPINYVEPQEYEPIRQNDYPYSPFTISSNYTFKARNNTSNSQGYARSAFKYEASGYNTALGYESYLYISQNYNQLASNANYHWNYTVPENNYDPIDNNSLLWATHITPYKAISETTTQISFYQRVAIAIQPSNSGIESLQVHYHINWLISNSRDMGGYVDVTSYDQENLQASTWNSITDPNMGFLYNEGTDDIYATIDRKFHSAALELNIPIEIDTTKDNYLFIWARPYVNNIQWGTVVDPDLAYYTGLQSDYSRDNIAWYDVNEYDNANHYIAFSGQYLAPIQTYEVVDIPGMIFEIITMPFTFISQAFNLTLFPGTPYQINISNLIMTIFSVLVFIFIFRFWLKARG